MGRVPMIENRKLIACQCLFDDSMTLVDALAQDLVNVLTVYFSNESYTLTLNGDTQGSYVDKIDAIAHYESLLNELRG